MPKSMTGFGRAKRTQADYSLSMEIKSLNARYFDLNIYSPRLLSALESEWRKSIKQEISRGKIELFVRLTDEREGKLRIRCDVARAKAYHGAYAELYQALGEEIPPLARTIAREADIFIIEEELAEDENLQELCRATLADCLRDFQEMRTQEGRHLAADLVERLEIMQDLCEVLQVQAKAVPQYYRERLLTRITELLGQEQEEFYSGQRVAAEVAIFADKADVSEELTRLSSHLTQFQLSLQEGGVVGKKLDFLIQEMNRESNTIASKSQDIEMTTTALTLKTHVEQLREQIQNIE